MRSPDSVERFSLSADKRGSSERVADSRQVDRTDSIKRQDSGTQARPTGLKPAATADISAEQLINTTVYGANDEDVGEVGDAILTKDGKIDAVIIDVGGFLGIGEKPVAVAFEDLQIMTDSNGKLYVYSKFTREQLDAAPKYVKQDYEQNRDKMRLRSTS